MKNLIEMNNLTISFEDTVVDHISFTVRPGEIVGIVGESGSGKSMTALSLMGLLPSDAHVSWDAFCFMEGKTLPRVGQDIAMIFQEPMTSLNPVLTVGKQVEEVLRIHGMKDKAERKQRVAEMLSQVELPQDTSFQKRYPHELSGGQRQRVMIAMALIANPKVLIADEPTTALDAMTQEEILALLDKLNKDLNIAILFISHDILLVHRFCHHVFVMDNGNIVERGDSHEVFHEPKEDYTKSLLAALPSIEKRDSKRTVEEKEILKVKDISYSIDGRQILSHVSFSLEKGEVLGIMGPSGCGKTTLSQIIAGLKKPDAGLVDVKGHRLRMVFQDPYGSLNPCKTIEWILEEPLRIEGRLGKTERKERVKEFLQEVGLNPKHAKRLISELSGGQRQRVAIAAALITYPDIIILDEPVSALDVTIQDKICQMLNKCKKHFSLSYLFISHDRQVMEMMCDRIIEMNLEKEEGRENHNESN